MKTDISKIQGRSIIACVSLLRKYTCNRRNRILNILPSLSLPFHVVTRNDNYVCIGLPIHYVLLRSYCNISSYKYLTLFHFTSSSFITGAGLKKCKPPNLSFLFVTEAMSWIKSDEVFEVKIVCLGAI